MVVAVLAVAGPAAAHEDRVAGGVRLVVGWGDEPAYTGLRNSVQVTITRPDGEPVTDLGATLAVEVAAGSDRVTLPLEPSVRRDGSGAPGDYRAWLVPTRPGPYTFRVSGTVGGQAVDETFSASPTTFDEVQDVAIIQFPAKDPPPSQLATRIEREASRLTDRLTTAEASLRSTADRARTVAVVGAGAGVLGLLVAGGVFLAARRRGLMGGGRAAASAAEPGIAGP